MSSQQTEQKNENHFQSDSGSDDEDIFVAEADYVQLSDDDDDNDNAQQPDSANKDLDDAFNCHGLDATTTSNPVRIPIDLEHAIDERLFSELEEKHSSELNQDMPNKTTADSIPDTSTDHHSNAVLQPLQIDLASSGSHMSTEHIDQIKNIMAGIKLGDNAIPDWAKHVPESAWMPKRQTPESS
ncbi:hypothetical protein GGH12_002914 [Coemansia sp. RSA 1822]|nr:hypothetical protein LPJ76_000387 [Coemansia sp. RSA 638]KAJ2562846.1 hypothetical protein GGH12_002914 [Coemansia sp. RSA 1822]